MRRTDLLLTLFGAFLWGIAPILHKFLLGKYNLITIMIVISLIYLICLLLCLPYCYKTVQSDILKINSTDLLLFLFA